MAHHAVWEGRRWARVGAHRVGLIARAPTRIIAGDARHAAMVSDVTIPTWRRPPFQRARNSLRVDWETQTETGPARCCACGCAVERREPEPLHTMTRITIQRHNTFVPLSPCPLRRRWQQGTPHARPCRQTRFPVLVLSAQTLGSCTARSHHTAALHCTCSRCHLATV